MDLKIRSAIVLISLGSLMGDEIEQCCQVGKIIPLDEADDCPVDEAAEPHEKMMCPFDCKLKSLGVLNGDEFVQEKVDEFVGRLEDGWQEVAKTIATSCIVHSNTMKGKMEERGHSMTCSPLGGIYMMCLFKHTIEQCPEDKWQNSELKRRGKGRRLLTFWVFLFISNSKLLQQDAK
uniref:Uncharacterized protein n=1 Tax=Anopheles christyi TaxID=43041 RepID=A0A9I3A6W7_9DIPT